jgi:hypothetical protein
MLQPIIRPENILRKIQRRLIRVGAVPRSRKIVEVLVDWG